MAKSDKVHDYRSNLSEAGVEMIVRPNNRYGAALPGERVLVDVAETRNSSTVSACMTPKEAERIERERVEREREAAKAKEQKYTASLQGTIEKGLEQLQARGRRDSSIVAAKKKAEREAIDAAEAKKLAEHRAALAEAE